MVPIAYSHPQSVRVLALHAAVLILLAAISISIAPSPRRLMAVVCVVPVSVVAVLIIMHSSSPVPVVVGACRQLLAPTIHPVSSGSQGWGQVLGRPSWSVVLALGILPCRPAITESHCEQFFCGRGSAVDVVGVWVWLWQSWSSILNLLASCTNIPPLLAAAEGVVELWGLLHLRVRSWFWS
jgi:hypothetical protein